MTTIPADCQLMFLLGLLFAWSAAPLVERSGSLFRNRVFASLVAFQTVLCMPVAIYCYVLFPDWCWMYWPAPEWATVPAFALYYAASAGGFAAGILAERRRSGASLRLVEVSVVLFAVFCALTWRRLFFVGDAAGFRAGTNPSLLAHGRLFAAVAAGVVVSVVALAVLLVRLGRRSDHRWGARGLLPRFASGAHAVSIVRVHRGGEGEDGDVREALVRSLDLWGGMERLARLVEARGRRVVVKPNLAGGGKDRAGTQTSPAVLAAVVDLVRGICPEAAIEIVESGSIIWWRLGPLLRGSRYEDLFRRPGVRFVHLGREARRRVDLGGRLAREDVPACLLEPAVLIDVPVAKTHAFYRMTGAVKNLFGLLPVSFKLLRYHGKGFADLGGRVFLDVYRNFPPDLVVVDGTTSCEGHGPAGTPKWTGFLLTADDAVSADVVLARIMGFDPREVPYLRAALSEGFPCAPALVGERIEDIRPAVWRRTNPWIGLPVNFGRILAEHWRVRRLRAG